MSGGPCRRGPRGLAAALLLLLLGGLLGLPPRLWAAPAPDTTRAGGLLEQLQQEDERFFSDDLFKMDPALRDSVVATLDSLGFEAYQKERGRRLDGDVRFDSGIASRLVTYNRVEGFLPGIELSLGPRRGWRAAGQVGYAFASENVRYVTYLLVSRRTAWGEIEFETGYGEQVVPYGSNRPTANAVRALVGSADEQDYLESGGGWGKLSLSPRPDLSLRAAYEAAEERSIPSHSTFAFLGSDDLMAVNAPVDEGTDRAARVGLVWGGIEGSRHRLSLSHRVAGGGLGGDFTYTRFEAEGEARRFILGGHEVHARVASVVTGGDPPVQRLADVGGLSTVRGFGRRRAIGTSSLSGRLELWLPYDPLRASHLPVLREARLQLVGWADGGRVWNGTTDQVLASAGFGIQRYLGPFGRGSNLRFDVAFPLGPERDEDVVLYLHFTPGYY